ncbi:hypothetical protein AMK21_06940 [Streptomyces sp. CB00316]|uniref:hypothetical protein n=1 Tax=unclassified Streptomyces TaxID=2593676 RepID=UPI000939A4AC|nr:MULTISPECIES: hypothetical protein [unclassified Streptomyces]MBT2381521.1 hypothetical protein [Streptomyces sp. ISL-111]OKJ22762.1 hypothetical protein AMK21_06940 [Streptomyces sp. CB00316]
MTPTIRGLSAATDASREQVRETAPTPRGGRYRGDTLPFTTAVLGVEVTVHGVDLTSGGARVAVQPI